MCLKKILKGYALSPKFIISAAKQNNEVLPKQNLAEIKAALNKSAGIYMCVNLINGKIYVGSLECLLDTGHIYLQVEVVCL
jgi:hypothetical protein